MCSKKDKVLFAFTLIFLAISSFSILGVAKGSFDEAYGSKPIAIAVAVAFWFGMILGYIFLIALNSSRKKARKKTSGRNKADGSRCGLLRFFSNSAAIITDSIMIISLIVFVIFRMLDNVSEYLDLTVIAIFVYSVHLHGILNGRNFMFITSSVPEKKVEIQENKAEKSKEFKAEKHDDDLLGDIEKIERPARPERPARTEKTEQRNRPEQRRSSEPRYRGEPRYKSGNRERPEQRYRQNKSDRPERDN